MHGTFNANLIAVRHRTIAAKYKAHYRDRRKPKSRLPLPALTLSELERIYRDSYGCVLPDDDAGRDDLILAMNYLSSVDACVGWAAKWAPWLAPTDAVSLAEQIIAAPQWLKARPLGERIGLTDAKRTRLKIRTIRPIDVTDEELVKRRKRKDRERKALKRKRARTAKPAPISQTKPWIAEGISRPQWYRRRRSNETKSVRNKLVPFTADTICLTTHLAREVAEKANDLNSLTKENLNLTEISPSASKSRFDSGKGRPPVLPTGNPRATSLNKPTSEIIDQAIEIVRKHSNLSASRQAVQRMVERFWPSYAKSQIRIAIKYYGKFKPDRDLRSWPSSFRGRLTDESNAIDRYRERRRKWKQSKKAA